MSCDSTNFTYFDKSSSLTVSHLLQYRLSVPVIFMQLRFYFMFYMELSFHPLEFIVIILCILRGDIDLYQS